VLAGARDDDRVTFTGVAGLPGRGQFCIGQQLAAALRGDPKKGSSFRSVGALPFGAQIRPVRDLIDSLLAPTTPAHMPLLADLGMA
jgi:hypothetical protein